MSAHVETIPYVSPASENNSETSDEVETDIIETFSETDDEELLVEASISQAARDLEASLLAMKKLRIARVKWLMDYLLRKNNEFSQTHTSRFI